MAGAQFFTLKAFSRKANRQGNTVAQVIGEANRAPEFSLHVINPRPPETIYGCAPSEVARLHDEMVAAATIPVNVKGKILQRAVRQDRDTLLTCIASYPSSCADANYLDIAAWERHNISFLKQKFGARLVSIMRHRDESHPHLHCFILPFGVTGADAKQLHPGLAAKFAAEKQAKAAGDEPRLAVKKGNQAYKAACRKLQDEYHEAVGAPCGLTRHGPRRRSLSRAAWQIEKAEAERRKASQIERDRQALDQNLAQARATLQQAQAQASAAKEEAHAEAKDELQRGLKLAIDAVHAGAIVNVIEPDRAELEAEPAWAPLRGCDTPLRPVYSPALPQKFAIKISEKLAPFWGAALAQFLRVTVDLADRLKINLQEFATGLRRDINPDVTPRP